MQKTKENVTGATPWISGHLESRNNKNKLWEAGGILFLIGIILILYDYLEPKWPLIWLEKALFWGGVDLQK